MTCTREAMQYKESEEPKVSWACIEVTTAKKWRVDRKLHVVNSWLRQRAFVKIEAVGLSSLSYFLERKIIKVKGKEQQYFIQEEMEAGINEIQVSRMVELCWYEAGTISLQNGGDDNTINKDGCAMEQGGVLSEGEAFLNR